MTETTQSMSRALDNGETPDNDDITCPKQAATGVLPLRDMCLNSIADQIFRAPPGIQELILGHTYQKIEDEIIKKAYTLPLFKRKVARRVRIETDESVDKINASVQTIVPQMVDLLLGGGDGPNEIITFAQRFPDLDEKVRVHAEQIAYNVVHVMHENYHIQLLTGDVTGPRMHFYFDEDGNVLYDESEDFDGGYEDGNREDEDDYDSDQGGWDRTSGYTFVMYSR